MGFAEGRVGGQRGNSVSWSGGEKWEGMEVRGGWRMRFCRVSDICVF